MANAVIYCRVSTDDQEKEGTSLQTQLDACLKYCHDKGYVVLKTFSETYTGTTLTRPQLDALRQLLTTGNAQALVVYCLDRLSRDPTHGVILTQEFEKLGIQLQAVTETVESSDLGRLISYIRGFASKLEVEKIKERTLRGKKAHLDAGKLPTGTGIGAYGYQWDKTTKKRVIIDTEAETVRSMFAQVIQGTSLSQIAKNLNQDHITTKSGLVWCHTTVRRTITNPIYCGDTYYGRRKRLDKTKVQHQNKDTWILLPDVTPAIIDRQTFDAAQLAIKARHRSTRLTNSSYFLTGLTSCPDCGSPICGATLNGKYRYYRCRGTMPTRTKAIICDARYIRADEIESFVWSRFTELVSHPKAVLAYINTTQDINPQPADILPIIDRQIKTLHTRIRHSEAKEKKLLEIINDHRVTRQYVLEAIDKAKNQKAQDQRQIDELLDTRKHAAGQLHITNRLEEMSEALHNVLLDPDITPEHKRQALQAFGTQITAKPGQYRFTLSLLHIDSAEHPDLLKFKPKAVYFDDKGNEHHLPGATLEELDAEPPFSEHEIEAEMRHLQEQTKRIQHLEKYFSDRLSLNGAHSSVIPPFTTIEQTSA